MATIPEITDRLEAATEKAENASQIIYDVANGDASTEVPTASGPTPTLKKWFQDLGSTVEPMLAGIPARLDQAILSYETLDEAQAAAATLPDGQVVVAPDSDRRLSVFEVVSGIAVFQKFWHETIDLSYFGGVGDGGITNNASAINNAIAEAIRTNAPIHVSTTTLGGVYAFSGEDIEIPQGVSVIYSKGASIRADGGASIIDNGDSFTNSGDFGGVQAVIRRSESVSPRPGQQGVRYNEFKVTGDDATAVTKVDGLNVEHYFGGPRAIGGRHALQTFLIQNEATSPDNHDRNYVGVTGSAHTYSGDGGTSGVGKGAYFGGNFYGALLGGNWVTNVTGAEFNTRIVPHVDGNEVHIHSGLQIASNIGARGYTLDTSILVDVRSNSTYTFRNGIIWGGQHASLGADSTVFDVRQTPTLRRYMVGPQCTESVIDVGDVLVKNNSLQLKAAGSFLELGSTSVAGASFIDFHSSGNNVDYDARIECTQGGAAVGGGTLTMRAALQTFSGTVMQFGGVVRPSVDNTHALGSAALRWSQVYAGTATINTSDENAKQDIDSIPDEVLDAWGEVGYCQYRMRDSVNEKGDGARLHTGLIAQRVVSVFADRGLNAADYGLLCFNTWDDIYEEWGDEFEFIPAKYSHEVDSKGDPILIEPSQKILSRPAGKKLIKAAGSIYGVRYEEALCMEAAYQRRRADRIEARLTAIEARL